ncbi:hypothetical protein ILUMI_09493 [Ignelater luminosus]|uniref:DDE-1 domain-containing protein n=1 Tax=Ignelater luminosus TaxID=2038154 RepID=A0A8K0CZM1_IGNLU|nr:hypothetical protein ILUMI_09493 [Ignelater luminosus]
MNEKIPFRQAVDCLMYISVATKPDITYAVSFVSESLTNPKSSNWKAVKRIFRYLKGTSDLGLLYQGNRKVGELEAFSEADYGGDVNTRRSRTRMVCKYSGAATTWMSQKQKCVVLSTTESEYIAACEGVKEVIWPVRTSELSAKKSAEVHRVPLTTLKRLVKSEKKPNEALEKKLGRFKLVFTLQQEKELTDFILEIGQGICARRNPQLEYELPPQSVAEYHQSEWMHSAIFSDVWFKHFLKYSIPTLDDPVLLIFNRRATQTTNLPLVEKATANNMHIIVIPPHTSNRLQLLDVSFMLPLNTYYERETKKWLINNLGKVITLYQVGELFGNAFKRAATTETGVNGFRATGIVPRYKDKYHLAAAALENNTYIDDILCGANDIEETPSLQNELISLLTLGHFQLHKWVANSSELLKNILPEKCYFDNIKFDKNNNNYVKTLESLDRIINNDSGYESKGDIKFSSKYTVKQVYTMNQEVELSNCIKKFSDLHYGLSYVQIRTLTFQFAKSSPNCKIPNDWETHKIAGRPPEYHPDARTCRQQDETLPHVLQHCMVNSAAMQNRHNAIVNRLKVEAEGKGYRVLGENQAVGEGTRLRSVLEKNHRACIVDVTVSFENGDSAFAQAREAKLRKYKDLRQQLERDFESVTIEPVVVGALGSWDSKNDRFVRTFVLILLKKVVLTKSGKRDTLVTFVGIVNAVGTSLPPIFVYPRIRNPSEYLSEGSPTGSMALGNKSGCMTSELFPEVLKHIVNHTHCSAVNKILLLVDNHKSHMSVEAIRYCKSNGITLLSFPPHATHRLQPLDVGIYAPFKTHLVTAFNGWMLVHPGQAITLRHIGHLTNKAYDNAFSTKNIKRGGLPMKKKIRTMRETMDMDLTETRYQAVQTREEGDYLNGTLEESESACKPTTAPIPDLGFDNTSVGLKIDIEANATPKEMSVHSRASMRTV